MKALQKNNIVSVVKHFPGHGATKQDSHYFLPVINIPMKKLKMKMCTHSHKQYRMEQMQY